MKSVNLLTAVFVTLSAAASASAECPRVPYHIGSSETQLSLHGTDLSIENLLCVAKRLKDEHPEWKSALIWFFDSAEAADRYYFAFNSHQEPLRHRRKYENEMRADYYLDTAKHEEYLTIMPFGWQGNLVDYTSRIDLPAAAKPHCRFEVADRCLLAAEFPEYPDGSPPKISGTVVLTGRVGRDGKIQGVRVADARSTPAESKEVLVRSATANFKTWRLDPSSREDAIRMTYTYVISTDVLHGLTQVDMHLPDNVIIKMIPY